MIIKNEHSFAQRARAITPQTGCEATEVTVSELRPAPSIIIPKSRNSSEDKAFTLKEGGEKKENEEWLGN